MEAGARGGEGVEQRRSKHVVVTALLAGASEAKTRAAVEAEMKKALARVQ